MSTQSKSLLSLSQKGPVFSKSYRSLNNKDRDSSSPPVSVKDGSFNDQVFSPSKETNKRKSNFKSITRNEGFSDSGNSSFNEEDVNNDPLNILTSSQRQRKHNKAPRDRVTKPNAGLESVRHRSSSRLSERERRSEASKPSLRSDEYLDDSDRELLGGGLSQKLKGIIKPTDNEDDFLNQIKRKPIDNNTKKAIKPLSRKSSSLLEEDNDSHISKSKKRTAQHKERGSAHTTAKPTSKLTKLAKVNFEADELKLIRESRVTASKLAKLTNRLKEDEEEAQFLSTLKKTTVWKPEILKSSINDDKTLDKETDLSLGLNNDLEVMDERQNTLKQRKVVKAKYEGKNFNGSIKAGELTKKVAEHWDCVPSILNGKIGSRYFEYASDVCKNSRSSMLTRGDFLRLPKNKISIGFYGMKRQSFIASLIKKEYAKEIKEASMTNHTVQFWTTDSFVLHVLTCEVVWRIVAKDLSLSKDEAIKCLNDTLDYGKYISDHEPIYDVDDTDEIEVIQ